MMLPPPNTTIAMKGVGALNGPANADLFADIPDAQPAATAATMTTPAQGGYDLFADVKAAPVSTAYDVMRSAGTGVRSGLEGLSGLSGDTAWLYRWLHNKAREGLGYESDPSYVSGQGDYWGKGFFGELPTSADARSASTAFIGDPYKPQTTAGEYAKTVGEFMPAAMLGPGSVARKALTFGLLPAVVSETAGQITKGTEAEPYARVAGAIVPGVGMSALSGRAAPTAASTARNEVVNAAERQGIPLPHVAVGDTPVQLFTAAKLKEVPVIGSPITKAVQNTVDTMDKRVGSLASGLGSTDKAVASQGAKDALLEWVGPGSDAINNANYARVDRYVNPNITVPLNNTRAMVSQMLREADASTSTSARSAIALVDEAVNRKGGLNYEGLKTLRTDIGARLSGKITPEPGTSQPALNRLYGALSEDLKNTVQIAGGPQGLAAFERANSAASAISAQRENLARIVGKRGDATPNAVLRGIVGLAGKTNAGSIERLKQVRDVLRSGGGTPGAQSVWGDVKAAIIADLGRDPSSPTKAFSPQRFMTAYGKLSDQGKSVLFQSTKQHLDDLALISERHRELMRMGNPSGTGGVVTGVSLVTWLAKEPVSAMTAIAGMYGTARLLSRKASAQKVVTWAKARNGIIRGSGTVAVQAHLAATRGLADEISKETGKPYREVFRSLMSGKPTSSNDNVTGVNDSNDNVTNADDMPEEYTDAR